MRLFAEGCKTADGHQFEFGLFHDYYYIVKPFNSMPYLGKSNFMCFNWTVKEHGETVEISEDPSDDKQCRRYTPIRELYSELRHAERALLDVRRQWLKERTEEIEEFAHKVACVRPEGAI